MISTDFISTHEKGCGFRFEGEFPTTRCWDASEQVRSKDNRRLDTGGANSSWKRDGSCSTELGWATLEGIESQKRVSVRWQVWRSGMVGVRRVGWWWGRVGDGGAPRHCLVMLAMVQNPNRQPPEKRHPHGSSTFSTLPVGGPVNPDCNFHNREIGHPSGLWRGMGRWLCGYGGLASRPLVNRLEAFGFGRMGWSRR